MTYPTALCHGTQHTLKPLKPGAVVAVISPAAPTQDAEQTFQAGLHYLEAQGYRPKLMPNARNKQAYLAGSDQERLADLHAAFADPEVEGILCARGGYGCMRLLPQVDFGLIAQNPKVFIGFSDVTALHIAFYQEAGLRGFYGPMLTSNLVYPEEFLSGNLLFPVVKGGIELPYTVPNHDPYHCLNPGEATAPLLGGNLSLLAALCGTPWQPKTAGHILFIEDWKEQYYTLDRQIQQLRLAGLFDNIAGLLFCDMSEITPEPDYPLEKLLQDLTQDLGVPVGYGYSIGHGKVTATLPYGCRASFNATTGTLTLLELPFCSE